MESKLFKRILSFAMVVFMITSMLPMNVFAENVDMDVEDFYDPSASEDPYYCPACKIVGDWEDVAEGAWNAGGDILGNGRHYRLVGDQNIAAALVVAADTTVCIDLNGHNITAPKANNVRVFENKGTLSIYDKVGTGVISGGKVYNSDTSKSSTQKMGGNIYNEGVFNLYGGTISGGVVTTSGNYQPIVFGGNLYGAAGSVTNIYGGTITGGDVTKGGSYTNAYIGGGNLCIDGELNIEGGTISDGRVHFNYNNKYENRELKLLGGNIYLRSGAVMNMYDGTVTGGKIDGTRTDSDVTDLSNSEDGATSNGLGGNIYATGATVNISGGTISNGQIDITVYGAATEALYVAETYTEGGNIYVGNASTLNITGGTISGGSLTAKAYNHANSVSTGSATAIGYGGNIFADGSSVSVTGGTIKEGVVTTEAVNTYAGAKATSYGRGAGLFLRDNTSVVIGGKAQILDNTVTASVNADNTVGCNQGGSIYLENNALELTGDVKVSGGKIDSVHTAATAATYGSDSKGGNIYFVGANLTVSGNASVIGGTLVADNSESRGGNIFVPEGRTLTLRDNVMISEGKTGIASASRGGNIFCAGTLNMHSGTIKDGYSGWGNNVMLPYTGKMNMYSGTISGGTGNSYNILNQRGILKIYDGTVTDTATGYAAILSDGTSNTNGSNTYLYNGIFDTVTVNRKSNLYIFGGEVKAVSYGKNYAEAGGTTTVYSGTLAYDPADTVAACSHAYGSETFIVWHPEGTCATCGHTFGAECATCGVTHEAKTCIHSYVDGACQYCGKALPAHTAACTHGCSNVTWLPFDGIHVADGGHYYLTEDLQLPNQIEIDNIQVCIDLNGYTLTGPMALRSFYMSSGTSVLCLMDTSAENTGTLKGYGYATTANGGMVYVNSGNTFYLYDATITGGITTADRGANIYSTNGTVVIDNGKVTNGVNRDGSASRGGNICLYNPNALLIVKGSEARITGGMAIGTGTSYGGNIYCGSGANIVIYDGEISGGYAARDGANIELMNGKESSGQKGVHYMYGGTIGDVHPDTPEGVSNFVVYGSASYMNDFYVFGGHIAAMNDNGNENEIKLYGGTFGFDPRTVNSDDSSALGDCACVTYDAETGIYTAVHTAGTGTCEICAAHDNGPEEYTVTYTNTGSHTYGEGVLVDPTCTEQGYTKYTCTDCGSIRKDTFVAATGHTYGEWINNGDDHKKTCLNGCGDEVTEGHTFDWSGGGVGICVCGATQSCNHQYSSVVTAPTCEDAGFTTHTCSLCGDTYTDTPVEALGHDYKSVVTDPTCTTGGYTTYTCTVCSHTYTDNAVDPLGHDYKSVVTPPTCGTEGYTTFTCDRCDHTYTGETVPATPHAYGDWTDDGDGNHSRVCDNDPSHIETAPHEHTAVVTAPNCTEQGYTTHTCVCGNTYTDTYVDPDGVTHNYDENGDCTRCDASVIARVTDTEGTVTYYATFAEALAYANGNGYTVKALKNVSENLQGSYSKVSTALNNVTIDANPGVTIVDTSFASGTASYAFYIKQVTILENVDFTIKCGLSVVNGESTVKGTTHSYILSVNTEGTIVIEGTVNTDGNTMVNGGTLKVSEGGVFNANNNSNANFIGLYNGAIEVNDGTINCDNFKPTHTNTTNVSVTFNNATLNAREAICVKNLVLTLEGTNTITLAGEAFDATGITVDTEMGWVSNSKSFLEAVNYELDIVLVKNTTIASSGATLDYPATVDLNGHTLSGPVKLAAGGSLTLVGENTGSLNITTALEGKCVQLIDGTYVAADHTYGDWVEGVKTCTSCGATTECAHNYESVVTAPTCEAAGYTTHTCTICTHSYTDTPVDALGHDYGNWTDNGENHKKVCANDPSHVIYGDHEHDSVVTAPTCEAAGYTTHTCVCGNTYTDTPVDALGHDYGNWIDNGENHKKICANDASHIVYEDHSHNSVVTEPTCEAAGYTTHTCVCGNTYTDTPVEATGHSYGNWTDNGDGTHTRVCSNDVNHTETAPHAYDSIVTAPNCTEQGFTTHTCACGASYVTDYTDPDGVTHEYDALGDCIRCDASAIAKVTYTDGTVAYYTTFLEALVAANGTGATVKALKNVEEVMQPTFADDLEVLDKVIIDSNPGVTIKDTTPLTWDECPDHAFNMKRVTFTENVNYSQSMILRFLSGETVINGTVNTYILSLSSVKLIVNGTLNNTGNVVMNTGHVIVNAGGVWNANTNSNNNFVGVYGGTLELNGGTLNCDSLNAIGRNLGESETEEGNVERDAAVIIRDGSTLNARQAIGVRKLNLTREGENTITLAGEEFDTSTITYDTKYAWVSTRKSMEILHQYDLDMTLEADIKLSTFVIDRDMTVTLNGFTLTGGPVDLAEGGSLTLVGENAGKLNVTTSLEGKCVWVTAGEGTTTYTTADHVYSDWVEGVKTCSNCGDTLECVHEATSVVTDPTCETAGYTTHSCSVCLHVWTDTEVAALGHSYGDWSDNGDGTHSRTCATDNSHVETVEHDYEVVVTEPNCTATGYTTHTCKDCGYSYQDNETETNGVHSYDENGDCVRCGDSVIAMVTYLDGTVEYYKSFKDALVAADGTGATVKALKNVAESFQPPFSTEENVLNDVIIDSNPGVTITDTTEIPSDMRAKTDFNVKNVTFAENVNFTVDYMCLRFKGGTNAVNGTVSTYILSFSGKTVINGTLNNTGNVIMSTGYVKINEGGVFNANTNTKIVNFVGLYGGTLEINGGTLNCDNFKAVGRIPSESDSGNVNRDATVIIRNGTVNARDALMARKLNLTLEGENSFTVVGEEFDASTITYETKHAWLASTKSFIDEANYYRLNYTLMNNIDLTSGSYDGVSFDRDVTVDLNGYTLSGPVDLAEGGSLTVYGENAGTLTVTTALEGKCVWVTTEGTTTTYTTAPHVYGDWVNGEKACINCGVTTDCDHIWDSGVVTAPTCEGVGYTTYTCTVCSSKYTDNITAPTGHTYGEWTDSGDGETHKRVCLIDSSHIELVDHTEEAVVTAPTCTADGYTTYTCTVCGSVRKDDFVTATGHTFDQQVITDTYKATDATCVAAATYYYSCSCGEKSDNTFSYGEVNANAHVNLQQVDAKAPTCEEIGWNAYEHCDICGHTTHVELPSTGHTLIQVVGKAPTCTEIGWNAYEYCSACDYTTYEEIAASGHILTQVAAKAPTCTEIGWNAYEYCSVCGYTTYEELATIDHSYDAVYTPATNTENAYTTYTCKHGCGSSYIVVDENTMLNCAQVVETGATFATVQEALNAATKGQTVKLLRNAEAADVYVGSGKTLDLNGKTLTVSGMLTAPYSTTHIIDNTNGDGLLVVDSAKTALNGKNSYLPVWTAEGVRFVIACFKENIVVKDENTIAYQFYLDMHSNDTILDEFLENGTEGTGLAIRIKVTYTTGNGMKATQYFYLTSEMVAEFVAVWDTKAIQLTILDAAGRENLEFNAEIVSTAPSGASVVVDRITNR